MSGEVKNWIPGSPGRYVTILDLKERWMKKKQQEEEEEEKRLQREAEKEKASERLDGRGKDRVEAKPVGASSWKSGGRGRGGRVRRNGLEFAENVVRDGDVEVKKTMDGADVLLRVEKSEYKKKDLVVGDVSVNGVDVVGKENCSARHHSVKRLSRNGSCVKGRGSDLAENGDVDGEKSGRDHIEDVGSVSDGKVASTKCPCHSRSENQGSGGFWVCKYVEPMSGAEVGESAKGEAIMEGGMGDVVRKKNGRMEEVKLRKKHQVRRKVREEMSVEQEREDAVEVNVVFSRVVNLDDVTRKTRQPPEKWEMVKGVRDEVAAKQEAVAVDKDSRRMTNGHGSSRKNDLKLQSQTVKASVEIEEHPKDSAVTETETIRKGKSRARGNPVGGRKINDAERFKAERISGSLTADFVKKEAMRVNSSCNKAIEQGGTHHKNNGLTPMLDMEPMDFPEKSEAAVGTEMVENSSDKFRDMRNETYRGKRFHNRRLPTDRTLYEEKTTHSKNFNGRMREMKLRETGLIWVKKGELSLDNSGTGSKA